MNQNYGLSMDNRLSLLLQRRISDNEFPGLFAHLGVDLDHNELPNPKIQTLIEELDTRAYGSREEWATVWDCGRLSRAAPLRRAGFGAGSF